MRLFSKFLTRVDCLKQKKLIIMLSYQNNTTGNHSSINYKGMEVR